MKIKLRSRLGKKALQAAFTMTDVLIGTGISMVMFVSLYLGITEGFAVVQVARENLRASQILQEKMETVWLYNWDQLNAPGFVPPTFTTPFTPMDEEHGDSGIRYQGSMTITNAPVEEGYSDDLRLVIVRVDWTSGNVRREREMRTLVSRHGLHNYIY